MKYLFVTDLQNIVKIAKFLVGIHVKNQKPNCVNEKNFQLCAQYAELTKWIVKITAYLYGFFLVILV